MYRDKIIVELLFGSKPRLKIGDKTFKTTHLYIIFCFISGSRGILIEFNQLKALKSVWKILPLKVIIHGWRRNGDTVRYVFRIKDCK